MRSQALEGRQQQIEAKPSQSPCAHAEGETPVSKNIVSLEPEARCQKNRKETDHCPIIRHACAIKARCAGKPFLLSINPEFQNKEDDKSQHEQINHFAAGKCGIFPKAQLESEEDSRE